MCVIQDVPTLFTEDKVIPIHISPSIRWQLMVWMGEAQCYPTS